MIRNLFADIPATLPGELVETLCRSDHARIERIVSRGEASPVDSWYDQDENEFVLLVSGQARIGFADGTPVLELTPGDWLDIRAHVRHRVEWTDPKQDTIWLAVHYR